MTASLVLDVSAIKPGMILEKDVLYNGKLLLAKGTVVKPNYIEQLTARGISKVSVLHETSQNEEILSNPVKKFYSDTYRSVEEIILNPKRDQPLTTTELFPIVENILEAVFGNQDSMLLLTGFKGAYNYLYAHSLDVCIYSLITAKAMDLNYEDTVNLGIAALLHDIGKTKISDGILRKEGRLTEAEYEEVKKHSRFGYDIVLRIPGIKRNIARVVLQHHERCDGSGYPGNMQRDDIDRLARVIAIADIYDALTSDRVYCKKTLPHEAAEYLLCVSNSLIDPEIAPVFLQNIAIYPPGCQVLLNTKEVAVVLDSNAQMPLRPILKIITDKEGNPLATPHQCILESHPQICIVNIFN